jgi:copper transport protein
MAEARDAKRGLVIAVLALAVGILGVVALWRLTPSDRLGQGGDEFFTHIHTDKAMANVTVFPGHAGPVTITVQLETPDERPLTATALTVTLSKPEAGAVPVVTQALLLDDGRWRARMTAATAGIWTLALGIRIANSDSISVAAPILIK